MGRILAGMVQFVLFLLTFAAGSFVLHPFHLRTELTGDALHTRAFVWDGVLLMLLLYLLVLGMEAGMKRLREHAGASTVAVVLAGALGLLMKFGFLSVDR